jgi:hypothetical protein
MLAPTGRLFAARPTTDLHMDGFMRHSSSRFSLAATAAAALAALVGFAALPAHAESIATSASSAGSVSSRQLSDSIGQSSDSSS